MAKYSVELTAKNPGSSDTRRVEADFFGTTGDFVDFFQGGSGPSDVVFRVRSERVVVIERVKE